MNVRRLFTIEHLVHLLLVVFAVASVSNVATYFEQSGHNLVTSYAIGLALGFGLVAVSLMTTQVDVRRERQTFLLLGSVTLVVGMLSGTVQMLGYRAHLPPWQAATMGYGIPLVGECLLAISTALFAAAQQRRSLHEADAVVQTRIAHALTEAMREVDVSKVRGYVEQRTDELIRHKVDEVVRAMMGARREIAPAQLEAMPEIAVPETEFVADTAPSGREVEPMVPPPASKQDALAHMAAYLQRFPDASLDDVAAYIGRAKSTVSSYMRELRRLEQAGDAATA